MKYLKSDKMISYLFAVSSVLLAVACFTITSSFAFRDNTAPVKKWNVYFEDVQNASTNGEVSINNDRLNLNVSLSEHDDLFKFVVSLTNKGSFDARLLNINITDLGSIYVGTSTKTGKIYYLSDYVEIITKYYKDNTLNNVFEGHDLSFGDSLNKNSKNKLLISIKYKDYDLIDEDAMDVLYDILKNQDSLKFSLSVDVNYIEKK